MNKLVQRRGWLKGTITRAAEAVAAGTDVHTLENLKARLKRLEDAFNELNEVSHLLYEYANEDSFVDPICDIAAYETKYYETHALLSAAIKRQSTADPPLSESLNTTILDKLQLVEQPAPLATIKVPTFCGNYADWPSFSDLFQSAIVNKATLTDVQRFHYLKSYLAGDALQLIRHLPITSVNYKTAWDRLVKRYDRKQLIIKSFVTTFRSLPAAIQSNAASLRKLSDGADEVLRGLDALGATSRDPWLIQMLLNKADEDTKRAWAEITDGKEVETLSTFIDFLAHRCDIMESLPTPRVQKKAAVAHHVTSQTKEDSNSNTSCVLCNQPHSLAHCPQFKALDVPSRHELLKTQVLCYNCLQKNHLVSKCPSTFRCRKCRAAHHKLVHIDHAGSNTNHVIGASSIAANHSLNSQPSFNVTLLPTAIATVVNQYNQNFKCRILLDSGSMVSLITEDFVQRIGVPRRNARVPISGLAACPAAITRGEVSLTLISHSSSESLNIKAFALSKLTTTLPNQPVKLPCHVGEQFPLPLADPSFADPGQIDILIGADFLGDIYTGERRVLCNSLVAMSTIFGWVLLGPCEQAAQSLIAMSVTNEHPENLDRLAQLFMQSEAIDACSIKHSLDDPAELHFRNTFSRDSNGRYIVHYPFKPSPPIVTNTREQAIKRLNQLERRLSRNQILKNQYIEFLKEYESLGHMERVEEERINCEDANC